MKDFLKRYLGENLTEQEKMFYLTLFMSSVISVIFALTAIIIGVEKDIIFLCLSVFAFSFVLLIINFYTHKIEILTWILLIACNYLAFPIGLLLSKKNYAEIPVYFLAGFTYGLVLLKGIKRIIYIVIQLVIDISVILYSFYFRPNIYDYYSPLSTVDYFRVGFAVVSTSLVCGIIILYRNNAVYSEIDERETAGKQAEQSSFAKDMFLVNVSHEIRTPLNAIIGTTDMLLESDSSSHIKEMAYNISNSSHALLSITSDLLDFSRMNIDSVSLAQEKYDISIILNDVINLMSVRLLDSNVDFYVDINPQIPRILYGDSGKIRQILVNMLSNAIKFTQEGHLSLTVSFDYIDKENLYLKISVEDTGVGIDPDYIDKIFEGKAEGNGLGLAFCRKLADAMGGHIYAQRNDEKGSTFHFDVLQKIDLNNFDGYLGTLNKETNVLFLSDGNDEISILGSILDSINAAYHQAKSPEEFLSGLNDSKYDYYILGSIKYEILKEQIAVTDVDWGKIVVVSGCNYSYSGEPFEYVLTKPLSCLNVSDLFNLRYGYSIRKQMYEGDFVIPDATILIVDDNLVNLEVAATILKRYQVNVLTAASGREGIICLNQEKVDLVLLDYMMPDMDGIDTLKEIRMIPDENVNNIPVVALTANVVSGAREMFIKAGFDDYLTKPIEVDKLEKVLLEYIPGDKIKFTI